MQVYLDYAAATPVSPGTLAAMQPYFQQNFYNPSALYGKSVEVKRSLSEARARVSQAVGVKPSEVIFTSGGTETNNMAVQGVARRFAGKHIICSALEHDSVKKPIERLKQNGWNITEIKPDKTGRISPIDVVKAVTEDTVLVSVMYANNEIGTVQPIREIAKDLQSIKKNRIKASNPLPIYFHTDACQASNYLDIHVHRLGVDLMTLNGGKIYGPKQSGVLIKQSHVEITPLLFGGGQEQNYRSGTENVAGAVGFAHALVEAQVSRQNEAERLANLQKWFIEQINQNTGKITVNGSLKYRLPNNIHISLQGADNERLLFALDQKGIQCATGSACSASKDEASHVLMAIGQSEDQARQSLRLTMGRDTTKKQLEYVLKCLLDLL